MVVPAWGRYAREPLQRALASIASQGVPARVIVVDNADSPPLAVAGVEVVRATSRVSLGAARNLGLAHAREPLVVVWDADDVMAPGTLRVLLDAMAAHPERVAHALAIIDADTGRRHRWPYRGALRLIGRPRLFAALNCVWSNYPTVGATIMRTPIALACGGYADAAAGEDWALGAALALRGPLGWSERPGRIYADNPDSVLSANSSLAHLFRHARGVRRHLSAQSGALTALAPILALVQWSAIVAVAAPVRGARWVQRRLIQ